MSCRHSSEFASRKGITRLMPSASAMSVTFEPDAIAPAIRASRASRRRTGTASDDFEVVFFIATNRHSAGAQISNWCEYPFTTTHNHLTEDGVRLRAPSDRDKFR